MKSFMKKERGLKLLERYSMPRTWEAKEELEDYYNIYSRQFDEILKYMEEQNAKNN